MDNAKSQKGGAMDDTSGDDYFAVGVGDTKQREPTEPEPEPLSTLGVDATKNEEAVSQSI